VVVRITYDSDWDTVEKILLNATKEVTKDIIEETGQERPLKGSITLVKKTLVCLTPTRTLL
jgi:hypothetical protein